MPIREIEARTLLAITKDPDAWFGVRYNMNLYRGCEHRCVYCDSRSTCYEIEDFDGELLIKANAIELLERELAKKRVRGTVGTGAMTDPYTPAEATHRLTGRALEALARHGFGIHMTTKSDLVLRDLELLREMARVRASVSFTLTTLDDDLARKIEPGAPPPSARLAALARLSKAGVTTGVTLMPVLPYIEDSPENVRAIITLAADAGARYVIPWLGVSLRDRQRAHFYAALDRHFPGLRARYERRYGDSYFCPTPNARELEWLVGNLCAERGLLTTPQAVAALFRPHQMTLF